MTAGIKIGLFVSALLEDEWNKGAAMRPACPHNPCRTRGNVINGDLWLAVLHLRGH